MKRKDFTTHFLMFSVIFLCIVAINFDYFESRFFLSFKCMLCIEKIHKNGFCFSLQKFNLKFKG